MPTAVIIFANPIAGRGKGRLVAAELAGRLARDGYRVYLAFDPPAQVRRSALPSAARCAIVIGGDGTVRSAAARLLDFSPTPPPLLVVPMGTANLLGKHLGTRWDDAHRVEGVSRAVAALKTMELDAAIANGELFLLMAGVGLDARIVHELDRIRSGPIAYMSYALPAAIAFGRYDYPPLTVTVDDQVIARDLPSVAFIGNIREYGTGFPILPEARADDGLLDVCVLPCAGRVEALRQFIRVILGSHLSAAGTIYVRGKRIRIESSAAVPVQVDGEAFGHTPLDVEISSRKLRFIVSEEAA